MLGQGSELIWAFVNITMHLTLPGITMRVLSAGQARGCAGLGWTGLGWAEYGLGWAGLVQL